MILGIIAGSDDGDWEGSSVVEFVGGGSSERWMASAEASSRRRERRVETECRA